jgi:ketosteroid isomerase-like protein
MLNSPSTVDDDRQAVAQVEYDLAEAHLQLDLDVIDRLLHPDYVNVQPGGRLETKAEFLASLRSDTRHWDVARADQFDIRLYGDTAIVIGRWRASGRHGIEHFDYAARFLSVWIKQDGRWQNIAYQATEMERQTK